MTRLPRRLVVSAAIAIVVLVGVGAIVFFQRGGPAKPVRRTAAAPTGSPSPSRPPSPSPKPLPAPVAVTCPLTGLPPAGGRVPQRPALAIKLDNLPAARPQAGLDAADIVYEEPVEAGITRFMAVFQCSNAGRVEPVRSGRLVDPDLLVQFGHPLLGYSGAIQPVVNKIDASGVIDVSANRDGAAYVRDPARYAPHNLYTSTAALWADSSSRTPPPALFPYAAAPPVGGTPATTVHIPFSGYSDVVWSYDPRTGRYLRSYLGNGPAMIADGQQIAAANVVVQKVVLTPSPYVEDSSGVHEWNIQVVGSGGAVVYRNGRAIAGSWVRPTLGSITRFVDAAGRPIPLRPGITWIELVPTWVSVTSN